MCGLLCGFFHGLGDMQIGAIGPCQDAQAFSRGIAIKPNDERLGTAQFVKCFENALGHLFAGGDTAIYVDRRRYRGSWRA